jgi:hypothetical protein
MIKLKKKLLLYDKKHKNQFIITLVLDEKKNSIKT